MTAADGISFLQRRVHGQGLCVLDVLVEYQKRKKKTYLFEFVCMKRMGWSEESFRFVECLLGLFNSIVRGQSDAVTRIYYRTEFLRSGFEEIKQYLRNFTNDRIEVLIEEYETTKKKDGELVGLQLGGGDMNVVDPAMLSSLFASPKEKRFLNSIYSFLSFLPEGKTVREACLKKIEKRILETVFEGRKTEQSTEELTLTDIRVGELLNREHELTVLCAQKEETIQKKEVEIETQKIELERLKKEKKEPSEIETAPIQSPKEEKKPVKQEIVKPTIKKTAPPPPPPKMKPPQSKQTGLKKISWKPLPKNKVEGTVWQDIKTSKWCHKEILSGLKEEFSLTKSGTNKKKKEKQITFVDEKIGRNIEIAFQGNRVGLSSFIKDFNQFDLSLPSLELASTLVKISLSQEEEKTLKDISRKESSSLTFPDRLLAELSLVSCYREKIQLVCIFLRVQEFVQTARTPLRVFLASIKRAQYSSHLKEFLSLFLAVGNVLNGTDRQNSVLGVCLDVLPTVDAIKGNTQSLLEFVVDAFERKYEEADLFKEDLEIIAGGIGFSLKGTVSGLEKTSAEFKVVADTLKGLCKTEQNVIREIENIERTLSELQTDLASASCEFKKLQIYFAEETNTNSGVFFSLFKSFLGSYISARQNICLRKTKMNPTQKERMGEVITSLKNTLLK
ncbi:MAG: formin homology 2 domain-containing protein [Amphiamblys sp. WSBS2006]|nr:MAG: formin homology 2 domain-containing protein [Amphiamblys sp. WSBS2006]